FKMIIVPVQGDEIVGRHYTRAAAFFHHEPRGGPVGDITAVTVPGIGYLESQHLNVRYVDIDQSGAVALPHHTAGPDGFTITFYYEFYAARGNLFQAFGHSYQAAGLSGFGAVEKRLGTIGGHQRFHIRGVEA